MKSIYQLSTILLLLCTFAFAQAQITGRVLDIETRKPIAGANVMLLGTDQGEITDEDGKFSLSAKQQADSIRVSMLGYKPVKVSVKDNKELSVQLSSTALMLDQVTVQGFENNRNILETAGAIATLDKRQIESFNNLTFSQALNTIPGVKMEENSYGGGSRILIRGTQLRAEFSTRNIKFYWNEIPFTDPSGETSLQFIDPATIGSIEVIKGPAGSIYGPGNGGVIIMRSEKADYQEKSVEVSNTLGSFNMRRTGVTAKASTDNINFVASYVDQQNDGFRTHSFVDKKVFNLFGQAYPNETDVLSFNLGYYDGGYALPGTLNREEFLADHSQQRPGSNAFDSRVSYEGTTFGLSYKSQLSNSWENVTSLFIKDALIDHPFGFAGAESFGGNTYTDNPSSEIGGRTRFTAKANLGDVAMNITFGGEYQTKGISRNTYVNNGGIRGDRLEDTQIDVTQALGFAQAELELPSDLFLTLGLSSNYIKYDISDDFNPEGSPNNKSASFDFEPVLAPRVALVKKLNANSSVHGSVSYGYSPPVSLEVSTNAGVNTDLQAEYAWNYEAGYRGTLNDKFNIDITSYYFQLQDAILPVVTSSSHSAFVNSGTTEQFGIEAALSYYVVRDPNRTISYLKPWLSYTYNNFKFGDYKKETLGGNGEVVVNDFSGNILTGTSPHNVVAGVDLETRFGLYANAMYQFVDELPLTDDNSLFLDAYSIVNAQVGYRTPVFGGFELDVFGGVGNATDARYVSFPALNGFGGRYYNPAPGRNFYGGARLKYNF